MNAGSMKSKKYFKNKFNGKRKPDDIQLEVKKEDKPTDDPVQAPDEEKDRPQKQRRTYPDDDNDSKEDAAL